MTKKKTNPPHDPEWNALIRIGEIKSRVNLALEEATTLITELEAKNELARRSEFKVIMRGVFELREQSESFIASIQDVPSAEVNGFAIPPRPTGQVRGVGKDRYEAVHALAREIKQREALG